MARLRPVFVALVLAFAVSTASAGPVAQSAAALSTAGWLRFGGLGASGSEVISGTVYNWGCRGGTLGRYAYRWGCAGTNNRYLMAHAYAEFEPLHDFVRARGANAGTRALVGKVVTWRTPSGAVQRYRVTWARVSSVGYWGRTGHIWAWNATSVPTITFQTCYGARSEYRIIVRAVLSD